MVQAGVSFCYFLPVPHDTGNDVHTHKDMSSIKSLLPFSSPSLDACSLFSTTVTWPALSASVMQRSDIQILYCIADMRLSL